MKKSLLKKFAWQMALVFVLTTGYVNRTYFSDNNKNKSESKLISMPTLTNINSISFTDKNGYFALEQKEQNWVLNPYNIELESEHNDINDAHGHMSNQPHNKLLNYFKKPLAKLQIDRPSSNLADYGLDTPIRTISLKNNNEVLTYNIGTLSPTAEVAYIKNNKSQIIYGIDKQVYQFLTNDAYFFVNHLLKTPNLDKLKNISIINSNYNIQLSKKSMPTIISEYQFTNSIYTDFDVDQKNLNDIIIASLKNYLTKPLNIVAFDHKKINNYGLDNPTIIIEIEDTNEQKLKLFISNIQDKLGGYYAYASNNNFIFTIDIDLYDRVSNIKPFVILNKFVSLEFIDNVKSIELKSTLATLQGEIASNGKNKTYKINSKNIEEDVFKKYYQTYISLFYEGITSDIKPSTPINRDSIVQVFNHLDGTEKTITYTPYNQTFYSVKINGKNTPFVVGRYQLDNLIKASQSYL